MLDLFWNLHNLGCYKKAFVWSFYCVKSPEQQYANELRFLSCTLESFFQCRSWEVVWFHREDLDGIKRNEFYSVIFFTHFFNILDRRNLLPFLGRADGTCDNAPSFDQAFGKRSRSSYDQAFVNASTSLNASTSTVESNGISMPAKRIFCPLSLSPPHSNNSSIASSKKVRCVFFGESMWHIRQKWCLQKCQLI